MRVALIANPSKFDDEAKTRAALLAHAQRLGWSATWFPTDPDDGGVGATEQALSDGFDLICALGGDGTVRSVATVLRGTKTPLGLIPAGTGNLLARNLGIPLDNLHKALTVALTGKDRPIDVGVMKIHRKPHIFLVAAGIGMDAEIMTSTDENLKKRVGWLAYLASGFRSLFRPGFSAGIMVNDDQPFRRRARMVLVCNCSSLMGGVRIAPEAAPDDGQLDLAVFRPKGPIGWAIILFRLLSRRHRQHGPLHYHPGQTFSVWLGRLVPAEADGDYITDAPSAHFSIEPHNLLVRVP